MRLGAIALDCEDPVALARFYGALLDAPVAYESERFAAVRLRGVWLTCHRVERHVKPTWPGPDVPKQAHLDVSSDDLDSDVQRALGLGATRPTEESPGSFVTLLDPAGHPFCLTTNVPDPDEWTG
ncbi:MAG TPA: VOC family protein [Acidimicrobiales bacterium]|nr:VOC family protein [Acidimicrobiales bacterium]